MNYQKCYHWHLLHPMLIDHLDMQMKYKLMVKDYIKIKVMHLRRLLLEADINRKGT